jgi:hypothetical protein
MVRPARQLLAVCLLACQPVVASAALDGAWRAVPDGVPADSLPVVLRTLETRAGPGVRAGEAAYAQGQFRYARGEYVLAAEAFLRSVTWLGGLERVAARYAYGLSALAAGAPATARPSFEDVARSGFGMGALGLLGVAQCWDAERRPDKAFDVLHQLLAGAPGEAGPAALERYATLAAQFHRDNEVRAARRRLAHEYPRSIEAARIVAAPPELAPASGRARGKRLETGATPARLPGP